jgi:hypothetical protein
VSTIAGRTQGGARVRSHDRDGPPDSAIALEARPAHPGSMKTGSIWLGPLAMASLRLRLIIFVGLKSFANSVAFGATSKTQRFLAVDMWI